MFLANHILKKHKIIYLLILIPLFLGFFSSKAKASNEVEFKSFVYFTGIGCPHCAKVAPTLHEKVDNEEGLLMIEYELYKESSNSRVITDYQALYNYNLAIPLAIYKAPEYSQGDSDILSQIDEQLKKTNTGEIQLKDKTIAWNDFNLNDLEGLPKIFFKDRAVVKNNFTNLNEEQGKSIKKFLLAQNLDEYVTTLKGSPVENLIVEYSGGEEVYTHGVAIGGWTLYWRGNNDAQFIEAENNNENTNNSANTEHISLLKVMTLAITDSINPCALSVLLMMLLAIATYHPKDKKQILLAGLAFVGAVFVTYFVYGLLIVKAFQFIQAISSVKDILYKGLGVAAILLGLLELKDFFFYKPGALGTEMPMFLRPKVQKIIAKITSPLGAFGLGMFVTLFLLPCTIGPYVILGGMLSYGQFTSALPYLSIYNLIFVLPMVLIILLVFFGSKNIKDISKWRENNVKVLHLIIGIIFVLLGLSMLFGFF